MLLLIWALFLVFPIDGSLIPSSDFLYEQEKPNDEDPLRYLGFAFLDFADTLTKALMDETEAADKKENEKQALVNRQEELSLFNRVVEIVYGDLVRESLVVLQNEMEGRVMPVVQVEEEDEEEEYDDDDETETFYEWLINVKDFSFLERNK